jgi:hypothetical protein
MAERRYGSTHSRHEMKEKFPAPAGNQTPVVQPVA